VDPSLDLRSLGSNRSIAHQVGLKDSSLPQSHFFPHCFQNSKNQWLTPSWRPYTEAELTLYRQNRFMEAMG
jgi:hypothetical protein